MSYEQSGRWPTRAEIEAVWRQVIDGRRTRESAHGWSVPWVEGAAGDRRPDDPMAESGLQYVHGLSMANLPETPNLIHHGPPGDYLLDPDEMAARLEHWLLACGEFDRDDHWLVKQRIAARRSLPDRDRRARLQRLLHDNDDPTHLELPPQFDFEAAVRRARELADRLTEVFGVACVTDAGTSSVQDASFLGDVTIPAPATMTGADIKIRLSNFGNLAVYAIERFGCYDRDELNALLAGDDRDRIELALELGGYVLLDEDDLWTTYDGVSDTMRSLYSRTEPTWWIRYFDYL